MELTVWDPSGKLSRINLTVFGLYKNDRDDVKAYPGNDQNKTLILIDLLQGVYAGKSVLVKF